MPEIISRIKNKARSYIQSALLSETARRVRQDKLTYLTSERLRRLENAANSANRHRIPGCFVEFGVALGGSAILLAKLATKAPRQFHGFDVFGMIPPPSSVYDDAKSKERYKIIASGNSTGIDGDEYYGYRTDLYSDVCNAFVRHHVPVDGKEIVLHKGLFENTLPECGISEIAFAHIDCDWYDPVKLCLEWVVPRLSPGARVILDDYHDYGGCLKAVDEFLMSNPQFKLENATNVALFR